MEGVCSSDAAVQVRLRWPSSPPLPWREDFYWGVWDPFRSVKLVVDSAPVGVIPQIVRGRNWAFVSNRLSADGPGLVHSDHTRENEAIAFRGYVLNPPLHSWSPSAALLDHWRAPTAPPYNGVFGAAQIGAHGSSLSLTTDAFGVAPLYWRELNGGLILFCTSARYLRIADDTLSPYSERLFMHRRALAGNASLLDGVERVGPGITLSFSGGQVAHVPWFDWSSLPNGDEPMSDEHVAEAERAFQTAIDRCRRLMPEAISHLPLSSGDDSRRILAALNDRASPFHAMTVRVLQKGNRDLDARFAAEMASSMGFHHDVIELADPIQFAEDDAACRLLFSSEVSEHSWIGPLIRSLPSGLSLVFDGLAGDIFGNTGFGVRSLYEIEGEADLAEVARLATPSTISNVLREGAWLPLPAVRARLAADMKFLPQNANRPDLAFLLIRARRGTGPCMQQLLPPGHLPVYPYLDLDHAVATLRANPTAKLDRTLQARCLERYWPHYYSFPGSRRFPTTVPEQPSTSEEARRRARLTRLVSEAPSMEVFHSFQRIRFRSASVGVLGLVSKTLAIKSEWWLDPFLTLEGFRNQSAVCEVN